MLKPSRERERPKCWILKRYYSYSRKPCQSGQAEWRLTGANGKPRMAEDASKQRLIRLLSRKAWHPVLRASPKKFSESGQKLLAHLQKKTETQKERYSRYKGAGEVRQEFQDGLSSQPARETEADLRRLKLPVQAGLADEFFRLADKLGVAAERGAAAPP